MKSPSTSKPRWKFLSRRKPSTPPAPGPSPQSDSRLLQIPLETFLQITEHLSPTSLTCLSLTCKSLHDLLTMQPGKEPEQTTENEKNAIKEKLLPLLERDIKDDHVYCPWCNKLHRFDIQSKGPSKSNLKHVHIHGCYWMLPSSCWGSRFAVSFQQARAVTNSHSTTTIGLVDTDAPITDDDVFNLRVRPPKNRARFWGTYVPRPESRCAFARPAFCNRIDGKNQPRARWSDPRWEQSWSCRVMLNGDFVVRTTAVFANRLASEERFCEMLSKWQYHLCPHLHTNGKKGYWFSWAYRRIPLLKAVYGLEVEGGKKLEAGEFEDACAWCATDVRTVVERDDRGKWSGFRRPGWLITVTAYTNFGDCRGPPGDKWRAATECVMPILGPCCPIIPYVATPSPSGHCPDVREGWPAGSIEQAWRESF